MEKTHFIARFSLNPDTRGPIGFAAYFLDTGSGMHMVPKK
jgi:hypothetical protein